MHVLSRQVRFSVEPFEGGQGIGYNSYSSKPCGQGMSIYLSVWIELEGVVDGDTGFVVNVADIDLVVRKTVVPLFDTQIKKRLSESSNISFFDIGNMLSQALKLLEGRFSTAVVNQIRLELNPFRHIYIEKDDIKMFYFSEKFEFSAMHTLWNHKFSEDRNFELFGKCANPAGHGHNYIIEVSVKGGLEEFSIEDFQKIVETEFIRIVDHKNLNVDVPEFDRCNPTVENVASFAWERLVGRFGPNELANVTVWENDRTYCTYRE